MTSAIVDPNASISFFFTADPQFGWGASYSGNEERYKLLSLCLLINYHLRIIIDIVGVRCCFSEA